MKGFSEMLKNQAQAQAQAQGTVEVLPTVASGATAAKPIVKTTNPTILKYIEVLTAQVKRLGLSATQEKAAMEVVHFLSDERYASITVLELLQLDATTGEVVLTIPEDQFFGEQPGYFQLRAAWPELDALGVAKCKITLNYRVDPSTGSNVLLSPGMGTGERDGWANMSSASGPVQSLLDGGYIADAAVPQFLQFVTQKLNASEKPTQPLTPKSAVRCTLRATIVPKNANAPAPALKGLASRQIVTNKAPGEVANLGLATVEFSGATMLSALSPFTNNKQNAPLLSMAEMMAKYSGRPVAGVTEVYDTI